jgi:ABC-type branched-subunit amino acid transport system permease subunit
VNDPSRETRYDDELSQPLPGAAEASSAEGGTSPAIGRDEWVARHGERRGGRGGSLGTLEARLRTVPWWAWLTLFVAVVALLPIGVESGYWRRVAFDTVIYMMLALGLNVVVGWGGLLDLGYVAFFGVGAYAYALLSSDQLDVAFGIDGGVHVPTLVAIAVAVIAGAVVGFLVGLPSRRLTGDYLAIMTLFFLLIFSTVVLNGDSIRGNNVTGGANGILNLDPMSFFGWTAPVTKEGIFNVAYLYIVLAAFAVVYVALRLVNESRTGRAWRSLREDALAAEVMGMPVNSLKLMAFATGAAVAAFTGSFYVALNASVFPQSYSFALLITVYVMVILGGSGSMPGVVIGAVLVSVMLEVLREPSDARVLFYAAVIVGILATYRLSVRLAVVVGGVAVFGFAAHEIAARIDASWVDGAVLESGRFDWVASWVIVPEQLASWLAPVSYVGLIALVLLLTLLDGWARIAVLIPTLYLAAFVWENVMLQSPESTRYIVLGAMLVALMVLRPNGLLGEKRVEIV